jgi:hypothetical protein
MTVIHLIRYCTLFGNIELHYTDILQWIRHSFPPYGPPNDQARRGWLGTWWNESTLDRDQSTES